MSAGRPRDVLVAQQYLVDQREEDEDRVMALLGYRLRPSPGPDPDLSTTAVRGDDRSDDSYVPDSPITEPSPPLPTISPPRKRPVRVGTARLIRRLERRSTVAVIVGGIALIAIAAVVITLGWPQAIELISTVVLLGIAVTSLLWIVRRIEAGRGIDRATPSSESGGGSSAAGPGSLSGDGDGTAQGFQPRRGRPRPDPSPIVDLTARRGLAPALLSVPGATSSIDLEALVLDLARGRPVVELPAATGYSLRSGFTVLIDRSRSMHPFLSDLLHLQHSLQRQFPGPGRRVLTFADHPASGVGRSLLELAPLNPTLLPPRSGRVLVVSNLGIGSRVNVGSAEAWVSFDQWLRSLGLSSLYLVPYPLDRLPPMLSILPAVEWRSDLTARQLRRAERPS